MRPEEVSRFFDAIDSLKHQTILTVCYAAGLRVSEAIRLTPGAFDSQRMVICVEAGKRAVASRVWWKWPGRLVSGDMIVARVRRRGQLGRGRPASRRAFVTRPPCAW